MIVRRAASTGMDPNRVRRGARSSPLIERDVVVGEPDVLGVEVAGHVRFDHRLELGQRISDRFTMPCR